jgi:hypothetical protein
MNSFLYPPGNNIVKDSKYKNTKDAMNAAVDNLIMRSAMGEYLGKPPLTSLAIPSPGPLDYEPKQTKSEIGYSITGKNIEKIEDQSPGPMKVFSRLQLLVRCPIDKIWI